MRFTTGMYQSDSSPPTFIRPRALSTASTDSDPSSDLLTFAIPTHQHKLKFETSLEDHIKKTRKAAAYLKQVTHAQSCQGRCGLQICIRISQILAHVSHCSNPCCSFPGCMTTTRLLQHSRECGLSPSTFCLLCTVASSVSDNSDRQRTASYDENNYMDVDDGCAPVINDEIIEFSRVPFQAPFSSPSSHYNRVKTYSESHVLLSFDQPFKKQKLRSKSLNIPCTDASEF